MTNLSGESDRLWAAERKLRRIEAFLQQTVDEETPLPAEDALESIRAVLEPR